MTPDKRYNLSIIKYCKASVPHHPNQIAMQARLHHPNSECLPCISASSAYKSKREYWTTLGGSLIYGAKSKGPKIDPRRYCAPLR